MFIWVAVVPVMSGSLQLLEGSLKFMFVCWYVHITSKDGLFYFFYNFLSTWGNAKGINMTVWFFRKNLVYLQFLNKVRNGRDVFPISWKFFHFRFWLAFFKKCLSEEILVLELWIKNFLTNNIVRFTKFNILALFNDFLVDDVIPWDQKVKRAVKKLLLLTICECYIFRTSSNSMGFIIRTSSRASRW